MLLESNNIYSLTSFWW